MEPGKNAINKKISFMRKRYFKKMGVALFILYSASCSNQSGTATAKTDSTAAGNKTGDSKWVSLFDGKTLNGWHGFNKTGEIKNWEIEDSAMVCLGAAKDAHGGDIVSDNEYGNFELTWDWKMSKGGNSGVMYHVIENAKYQAP
jgi:hypothetical protein